MASFDVSGEAAPAGSDTRLNGRPGGGGGPYGHGRNGHVYAALDLGTNNCRLLIARPARDGFRIIDAFSRIVRLGEGLTQTGRLGQAAIDRTLAALEICRTKMELLGVTGSVTTCRRISRASSSIDRPCSAARMRRRRLRSSSRLRIVMLAIAYSLIIGMLSVDCIAINPWWAFHRVWGMVFRPVTQTKRPDASEMPRLALPHCADAGKDPRIPAAFYQTDQPASVPCRRSLRRSSMESIRSSLRSRWTS